MIIARSFLKRLYRFSARVIEFLWLILDDLLFVAGAGLIVYGLGLIGLVWAYLGAGVFFLLGGLIVARMKARGGNE